VLSRIAHRLLPHMRRQVFLLGEPRSPGLRAGMAVASPTPQFWCNESVPAASYFGMMQDTGRTPEQH
jgi:hypothetical protein